MRFFIYTSIFTFLIRSLLFGLPNDDETRLQPYVKVLSERGKEPINFVIDNFQKHDLIIFDDAYDALIFLGPLEKMHKTAIVDFIYTQDFKRELMRRYHFLFTEEQLNQQFKEHSVKTLEELIDNTFIAEPQKLLPQAKLIEPIDVWKGE
jgi:hypothetical protein